MLTALFFTIGITATPPDACAVLSARDIARVQGTKHTKTRLTESTDAGLSISQCRYTLPRFTDSVTVDLIRGGTRAFWQKHFADEYTRAGVIPAGHEHDAASASHPPRAVPGVGEQAVWSGNRLSGALYVLQGNTVIRISAGGGGTEEQKIDRAKKLAQRVVRKL